MKYFRYLIVPPIVALFVFLVTTYIIYTLVSLAPSSVPPNLSPEAAQAITPAPTSFNQWLSNQLAGNFGQSFRTNRPVTDEFYARLPATLELFNLTVLGSLILGIPLGVLMAALRRWLTDGFIRPLAWLGGSMPVFWVGLMLILLLAIQQRVLPTSGRCAVGSDSCEDYAEHLVLPMLTLLIAWIPVIALYVRGAILRSLEKPAGAPGRIVHGVVLPTINMLPVFFAGIISSLMLVEPVFAWPGVGRLLLDSLFSRDLPVAVAIIFTFTYWFTLAFLVAGLLTGAIALLLGGDADDEPTPQPDSPAQSPAPKEPVGLFAEDSIRRAGSGRLWIDRIYTALAVLAALAFLYIAVTVASPGSVTAYDPLDVSPADRLLPPGAEDHPYGTDTLGRDLQARVLVGGQTTLGIAFRASLIALAIGAIVGFVGGLFMNTIGVVLNIPIQIVVVALNILPFLPILALAFTTFRPEPEGMAVLFALFGWGSTVLPVRTWVANFFHPRPKQQSLASWLFLPLYLLAANMAFFILAEASLSFLGLGVQPPTPSWGSLLSESMNFMAQAEYLIVYPGVFITVTVFCLYVVANRLRDRFNYN